MSWAEQRARLLGGANTPEVLKDAAYWQSRCWRSGCENLAETDERRWRGRYCPACLTLLAADAERIAVEFGVSA